jgi:hypothetical protein
MDFDFKVASGGVQGRQLETMKPSEAVKILTDVMAVDGSQLQRGFAACSYDNIILVHPSQLVGLPIHGFAVVFALALVCREVA